MNNSNIKAFDTEATLKKLRHYLPAQAPLKDFVPNNTLQAFQNLPFHTAMRTATELFGYKTYMTLPEFRKEYQTGRITEAVLDRVIIARQGKEALPFWKNKAIQEPLDEETRCRVGQLRKKWKEIHHLNLDKDVHPLLFKIINAYLDQGISIWNFPVSSQGLLCSLRELEKVAFTTFFKSDRVKNLFFNTDCAIPDLLKIVVGDESLYEQYLFDQQFTHPGWSGMVSVLESRTDTLLDKRCISLGDFIALELLLEIDVLERKFNGNIMPLGLSVKEKPAELFAPVESTDLSEVYAIWQEAFEWSYYDQVLSGIHAAERIPSTHQGKTFEALLCIDDREISFRYYIEKFDPLCKTFGTPGFFNVECYFQPEHSKFHTKICPAPLTPKYLIKEIESDKKMGKEAHFTKHTHSLLGGLFISMTLGFWSLIQLFFNIFRPGHSATVVSSFRHMDKKAKLTIENTNPNDVEGGLQVGYNVEEMTNRVEGLLKSIGLVDNFAPIIYAIGHGASSVNNTFYAEYDCGACSSRPGSVNARSIAFMGNHPKVRALLETRGIFLPPTTQFLGAMHDTTRDEIEYYDEECLSPENRAGHLKNMKIFEKALSYNAKERSRRFILVNSKRTAEQVHKKIKERAFSLFEPRPELNHATNALCVVAGREMTEHLFLDKRSFLNSYNYKIDPTGKYLLPILNAATPVCGGINLQFYFSRVDNYRLGASTKLPHNVMGLYGVANGMEGDLRTGLPKQVVEIHEPIRLLMVVEHYPEVVLDVIKQNPATYEWYINAWMPLIVVHPETHLFYRFEGGKMVEYVPSNVEITSVKDLNHLIESSCEHFPVFILNE